ncbi:MbnP family protein [Flavobacterium sp.]
MDSLTVNFHLEFGQQPLELNRKYTSLNDTLTIEHFRCYISNITILYEDKSLFVQKDSYHLLDSERPASLSIPLTQRSGRQITKISFNIGIDSLTNTSGAMDGDLDPVKGMYWAWQSGYINMKVEGKSPSCKTRKNQFQFHIGGYLQPYYAMRKVELVYDKKANPIDIGINLKILFSNVSLAQKNSIMIPCKDAMDLADESLGMFYIK